MGLLMGTSVFMDHERGRLYLASLVQGREDEEIYLSVIGHPFHSIQSRGIP